MITTCIGKQINLTHNKKNFVSVNVKLYIDVFDTYFGGYVWLDGFITSIKCVDDDIFLSGEYIYGNNKYYFDDYDINDNKINYGTTKEQLIKIFKTKQK